MKDRMWGNEYRQTTVCVDSYEDGVLRGRIYNPYLKEGIQFKSLSQFLIQAEGLLDGMDFPKPFTMTRTFSSPPESRQESSSASEVRRGSLATFVVRVLFRQHTSWQGSIAWVESGKEESFRSVLELILLMDSALRGEE